MKDLNNKKIPYINIYVIVILLYLSAISHKEPKFLLPIFPPFFLMIGFCISNLY